jgi:hypothetical protein
METYLVGISFVLLEWGEIKIGYFVTMVTSVAWFQVRRGYQFSVIYRRHTSRPLHAYKVMYE